MNEFIVQIKDCSEKSQSLYAQMAFKNIRRKEK